MWLLKSNMFCLANSAAERQMTSHHIHSTSCGVSHLTIRPKPNRYMENGKEGCREEVDGLWQVGSIGHKEGWSCGGGDESPTLPG